MKRGMPMFNHPNRRFQAAENYHMYGVDGRVVHGVVRRMRVYFFADLDARAPRDATGLSVGDGRRCLGPIAMLI